MSLTNATCLHSLCCLFFKGGFLSAIVSIGLLIALALTPHNGKNQTTRMGKCSIQQPCQLSYMKYEIDASSSATQEC